jgi:hypothetical protein
MGNILAVHELFRSRPVIVLRGIQTLENSICYYGESVMSTQGDQRTDFNNFLLPRLLKPQCWTELQNNPPVFQPRDFYLNVPPFPFSVCAHTPMTLIACGWDPLKNWWLEFGSIDKPLFQGNWWEYNPNAYDPSTIPVSAFGY